VTKTASTSPYKLRSRKASRRREDPYINGLVEAAERDYSDLNEVKAGRNRSTGKPILQSRPMFKTAERRSMIMEARKQLVVALKGTSCTFSTR